MSKINLASCLLIICFTGSISKAADQYGFNLGFGLPYTSQMGLNYISSSNQFSAELSYNVFSLTTGVVEVKLSKPELNLKWHPFSGSFFLGMGLGQQTLSATGTDVVSSNSAKVSVTSTVITPNMGWMWGTSDGGLFAGIDFGFQNPSGAKTTIETTLPVTDQAYIDAVEEGDKLGNTGLPTFTLLRVGYLF